MDYVLMNQIIPHTRMWIVCSLSNDIPTLNDICISKNGGLEMQLGL